MISARDCGLLPGVLIIASLLLFNMRVLSKMITRGVKERSSLFIVSKIGLDARANLGLRHLYQMCYDDPQKQWQKVDTSIEKTSFCPRASWTVLNDRPLVLPNTASDSKR